MLKRWNLLQDLLKDEASDVGRWNKQNERKNIKLRISKFGVGVFDNEKYIFVWFLFLWFVPDYVESKIVLFR